MMAPMMVRGGSTPTPTTTPKISSPKATASSERYDKASSDFDAVLRQCSPEPAAARERRRDEERTDDEPDGGHAVAVGCDRGGPDAASPATRPDDALSGDALRAGAGADRDELAHADDRLEGVVNAPGCSDDMAIADNAVSAEGSAVAHDPALIYDSVNGSDSVFGSDTALPGPSGQEDHGPKALSVMGSAGLALGEGDGPPSASITDAGNDAPVIRDAVSDAESDATVGDAVTADDEISAPTAGAGRPVTPQDGAESISGVEALGGAESLGGADLAAETHGPDSIEAAGVDAQLLEAANPMDLEIWEQVRTALGRIRSRGEGLHDLRLMLRPDALGEISLQITQEGQEISIGIVTETQAVADRLDRSRLLADLASAGLGDASLMIGADASGTQFGSRSGSDAHGEAGAHEPDIRSIWQHSRRATHRGGLDVDL